MQRTSLSYIFQLNVSCFDFILFVSVFHTLLPLYFKYVHVTNNVHSKLNVLSKDELSFKDFLDISKTLKHYAIITDIENSGTVISQILFLTQKWLLSVKVVKSDPRTFLFN
jgi:hypothetical protein